jgi:hypothetical protein
VGGEEGEVVTAVPLAITKPSGRRRVPKTSGTGNPKELDTACVAGLDRASQGCRETGPVSNTRERHQSLRGDAMGVWSNLDARCPTSLCAG